MSTFKGIVKEFPRIRIDYFRALPDHPPPLACFLSHVHSDHLLGLDSFRSPFIYCTPATREVLLRLEKYPHRMNFAKGILESRKQTYRHLAKLLKPIPLEVPTQIELGPGNQICVTLFDANHCLGSCMFLIQGTSGTAVLYTGDIRCETWFINSLVQNPLLIPYTLGSKRLDCLYLDTTFATKSDIHRSFPSKAEGLHELLEKVCKYPRDTIFYLHSWTFGYENVWVTLSAALNSQVHLDSYRWRIYNSLTAVAGAGRPEPKEAAQLCGFMCGNHRMSGCLTTDQHVRIHSCEKGTECQIIKTNSSVVRIIPIITRTEDGVDVLEPGAGGGLGDLGQVHELELMDPNTVTQLMALCALNITDKVILSKILTLLTGRLGNGSGRVRLDTDEVAGLDNDDEDLTIDKAVDLLRSAANNNSEVHKTSESPKTITFPYSRHSSYSELRELVAVFRPKDLHPCTVDDANWTEDVSMRTLFGEYCSGSTFSHDDFMSEQLGLWSRLDEPANDSQATQVTEDEPVAVATGPLVHLSFDSQRTESEIVDDEDAPTSSGDTFQSARSKLSGGIIDLTSETSSQITRDGGGEAAPLSNGLPVTQSSTKRKHIDDRTSEDSPPHAGRGLGEWAYYSAAGLHGMSWEGFGGLECTRRGAEESQEL